MDLIFSIPFLTYFFAPSMTSWSTSINLVFFYMTWATLVLSHKPIVVHLVGVVVIRCVFWLAPTLLSLLFDVGLPSIAGSFKHGGRRSLPPRDPARLARLLGLALFNLALVVAVEGALSMAFNTLFTKPEFKAGATLPFPWQVFQHILVLMAGRELIGYYVHRFVLHGDGAIADYHRRYAHSSSGAPFSLQVFTDHPVPLLLHRLLPLYLPALLLRPHLITYFLFVFFCTGEEMLAMSGYTFVPGIIMSGIAERSCIHYGAGGSSNFGTWGILDWGHGTNRGRDVFDDVKSEAEKHNVKERSAQKASEGMGIISSGVDALKSSARSRKSERAAAKKG